MSDSTPDFSAIIEEYPVSFSDGNFTSIDVFKNIVSPPSAPVCLITPALGVRGSFYKYLAFEMAQNGWNVATMDWRGNGKSSVKVSRETLFGFHEILTIDYPAIMEAIKNVFPGNPLFLLGHSLGGQLNLLYSCLSTYPVNGAVLLAGGSNFYKYLSFPRNYGRKMNYFLIQILTNLFGYFPGDRLGFAGKESKTMILDWLHESLTGEYSVRNCPYDFNRLLSELELPVLFISLNGDHFVTSSCARFLARKLKKAKTTVTELDASDYNLNIKKFTHFNWKNSPEPITKTINAWFNEVISSGHYGPREPPTV